jgi:hypothetical protein
MATDIELLLAEAGRHVPGPSTDVEERALRVVLALRPPPQRRRLPNVSVSQRVLLLLVFALAVGALGPFGEESPGQLGRRAASLLAEPNAVTPVRATVVSGAVAGSFAAQAVPFVPRRPRMLAAVGPERRAPRGGPARSARSDVSFARGPAGALQRR